MAPVSILKSVFTFGPKVSSLLLGDKKSESSDRGAIIARAQIGPHGKDWGLSQDPRQSLRILIHVLVACSEAQFLYVQESLCELTLLRVDGLSLASGYICLKMMQRCLNECPAHFCKVSLCQESYLLIKDLELVPFASHHWFAARRLLC